MAPPILTLKDFKAGKKTKLPILQVYVHTRLDEYSFVVCDKTDHATLSIHKDPRIGRNVGVGNYLRLVNPTYERECLIPVHRPCEVSPFEYKKLDERSIASNGAGGMSTFEDIGKLRPNTVVPSVVAKVTYLSPKKKLPSGKEYKTAGVRDVKGARNAVKLLEPSFERVEVEGVYKFRNVKVEDWKLDTDVHNRLSTRSDSDVSQVGAQIAELFQGIHEGDDLITGMILGHEKPYMYLSCPDCRRSVREDAPYCSNASCRKDLSSVSKVQDFNVVLLIQNQQNESQMLRALCFKRQFGGKLPEVENLNRLTEELNELSFKKCKLSYKLEEGKDEVKVVKIEFLD